MTISSTVNRNDYVGNGATTVYPYTFQIYDQTHVEVWVQTLAGTVSKLALTTDYTVSGVGLSGGGNIILTTALTSGYLLTNKLVLPLTQLTDLRNQGHFFGEVHERVFDRDIRIAQQLADQYARGIKLPETEIGSTLKTTIPVVSLRASKLLGFDENGNPTSMSFSYSSDVTVNNIAALRLIVGDGSKIAKTQGYYSSGDGGGNSFYYDTTSVETDNGGTIIKPTSVSGAGRWIAVDSNIVHVRQFGARCSASYDDKSKLQAAIDAGKRVDISNSAIYIASTVNCSAVSKLDIFGNGSLLSSINAHSAFSGAYLIDASVRYSFSGLSINGNRVLGQHGIGCNTVGTSGGSVKFDDVRFYHHDMAINFGEEFEHPLGLSANKLYIQDMINGGINIGGITGSASSGESCYAFTGGTIVTNNGSSSDEYAITVTTDTPSATQDTITVTNGNSPYYGYVYLRSSDGVNWSVPPNWSSENYTSTTFIAAKVALETWQYKAVRATIGVNIRRAKSVTFDNLQSEYFGIGLLTKSVKGLTVGAFYTESRASSPVRPNFAGVYLHTTTSSSINSAWAEGYGYGVFVSNNSTSKINGIIANNCNYAAIGDTGSTDQFYEYSNAVKSGTTPLIHSSPSSGSNDYNFMGAEYSSTSLLNKLSHSTNPAYVLMFRGVEKSRLEYDNTNGARINLSSARISPFSKTTISPTNQSNSALFTALTSGVATSFLNITIPNNASVYAEFGYVIRLADAGLVARQTIAGSLRVSGVSAAGTCAVSVTSNDVISAQSGGTPTIAFTATVSTNVITVLANVGTVMTGPLRIYLSANTYCSSDSTGASITQL